MNTNPVTTLELSAARSNWSSYDKTLRKAAVTMEIANRAITVLSNGGRMRAGEIATAIGVAGIDWRGDPCDVRAQQVGVVMRKLVSIGRVKREEVDGDPIEVMVGEKWGRDPVTREWVKFEAHAKTIKPKVSYYSLI